jgi:hypothetical protein
VDQFYFEEGYIVQGYHVYIAEASVQFTPYIAEGYFPTDFFEDRGSLATLTCIAQIVVGQQVLANGAWSSSSSLSAAVSKLMSSTVTLESSFSQTTIATKNSDIDLFAFSDAAISIQVQRLRDNNISASSAFNIAIDGARVRYIDSAEQSAFSFDVINQRSRATTLDAQAAFSLTVSVQGTTDEVSADLVATSTVYANGGRRELGLAQLQAFSSIFTSRFVGTDRPKTITGTFDGIGLINSSSRLTDLTGIPNVDDWYYQTWVNPTASPNSFSVDAREILYIPLGNREISISLRWRSAQGPTLSINALGVSAILASPGTVAISFTGGQRLSIYVNGTRVATQQIVDTAGWSMAAPDTVRFANGFPFTSGSNTWTNRTDYAWLTYGNYTNGGSASYTTPTPVNNENTIFFYEFNGNGNETTSLTQTGAAAIASTATVLSSLSGVFNSQSNIQSSSSLACTISHIEGADLTAFSDAALNAQILRIQQSAVSVQSQFSLNCQDSKVTDIQSNQSCSSTVNADISVIRNAQIATEAVGTQLTAVARLAGLFADDLVIVTLSANAVVTRFAVSSLSSSATVVADNFRVRFNSVTAISEFTNVVQGFVGIVGSSNISAQFAQTTVANRFRDTPITLSAVSELSATGNNLGKIESSLFDAVTMTTVAVKIASASTTTNTTATVAANTDLSLTKTYQSAISASFTKTITAEKRVGTFVFLTAFASKLTVAVKQTVTDLDVEIISSMSVSAVKTARTSAAVISTTTQTAAVVKTVRAISSQSSNFTQTADAIKAVFGSASLSVLAFELAAAVKTAGISISTNTVATMTVSAVKTARVNSNLNSNITVVAPIGRIRLAGSALSSNFTQTSRPGFLASAQITIASAMTFVSEVREIRLDEIVYVIPGEIWVYEITSETRLHSIGSETREYIIT